MVTYPQACPICGAEKIESRLYACFLTASPCDPQQIDLQVETQAKSSKLLTALTASLPERYRGYLTTPLPTGVLEANPNAKAAMAHMSLEGFVYLTGDADAGKTHWAIRQGQRFLTAGKSVLFVDETDYFARLFGEFSGKGDAPDLISPDLVIYDDLGKQKPSEFMLQKLYQLINGRWSRQKALVITSNFTPDQVLARLTDDPIVADALHSRLTAGQILGIHRSQGGRKGSAI